MSLPNKKEPRVVPSRLEAWWWHPAELDGSAYLPTEEEIERECERIRERWDYVTFNSRWCGNPIELMSPKRLPYLSLPMPGWSCIGNGKFRRSSRIPREGE